jgi:hypothetical protein
VVRAFSNTAQEQEHVLENGQRVTASTYGQLLGVMSAFDF